MLDISIVISIMSIAFLGLIMVIYIVALFLAYLIPAEKSRLAASLHAMFESNRALNVGIPSSALASLILVMALLRIYPAGSRDQASIEIKFFSLVFTGPSGPVTLWALCFLCFIAGMRLLR